MERAEADAFNELLDHLCTTYGKPKTHLSVEQRRAWWQALVDLPFTDIRAAAHAHIAKSKFFPRVAELRADHDASGPAPQAFTPDWHAKRRELLAAIAADQDRARRARPDVIEHDPRYLAVARRHSDACLSIACGGGGPSSGQLLFELDAELRAIRRELKAERDAALGREAA